MGDGRKQFTCPKCNKAFSEPLVRMFTAAQVESLRLQYGENFQICPTCKSAFNPNSRSLEKKIPFLYIFLLLLLVLGGIGYFAYKSDKSLTAEDAKPVITSALTMSGPASVRFTIGTLKSSDTEKPHDPHYKLLEKLGYLKLTNAKNEAVQVTLTPLGESTFKEVPEFKKTARSDGTESFLVPLATRELVAIRSVTSSSAGNATVTYEWKWTTNKLGEQFDLTSDSVQKFSDWDRSVLVNKYGVDFYKQSKTETVNMVRGQNGWQIATE